MVEDLGFIQDKYQSSLVQHHLLSEEEAQCVFGEIDNLLRVHRSLRDSLAGLRDSAGVTESIGKVLLKWVRPCWKLNLCVRIILQITEIEI
jgi:hypothetical protein